MSTGSRSAGSWIVGFSIATVVAVMGIILRMPTPELKWNEVVVPSAIQYVETVTGKGIDESSRNQPLRGIYIVVTGATSGIGLGLTRKLCSLGATVVAMGRSLQKLQQLKEEWPENVETILADFSDLDSIAEASRYMMEHYDHLDILVNNAGIHAGLQGLTQNWESKQAYDLTFAVNYLSHFLLTEKLMTLLEKSQHPKVVQVSSRFHLAVDGSDLSTHGGTVNPTASQKGGSHGFFFFRSQRQYGNSKLAQILHARAIHERYRIRAVSICPTWVGTQIGAKNGTLAHTFFESTAFPMDGFGLSSILHAILDFHSVEDDFYINTDFGTKATSPLDTLPSWTYQWLPIRDMIVGSGAFSFVFLLQRFFATRDTGRSSIQSYDKTLQEELYTWSRKAVSKWL